MTDLSHQYREMAALARSSAASALENVKRLHLQSADRLDQIAHGLERVTRAKSRDEAAKALASL
jgi:hypothetical protein